MKFKIEIDAEDIINELFYAFDNNEPTNFNKVILDEIKRHVVNEVKTATYEQVKQEITTQLINESNDKVQKRIALYIDEFMFKGVLHAGTDKEITIREMVERHFINTRLWDNLLPSIKKIGEEFAIKIKSQYDLQFASTILSNMKESGLLNNDAVKVLFKGNNDEKI